MADTARHYWELAYPYIEHSRVYVNETCKGLEAWQIIAYSVAATVLISVLFDFLFQEESLRKRAKKSFFKTVRNLPIIRDKIKAEMQKTVTSVQEEIRKADKGMPYVTTLPSVGLKEDQVLGELNKYKKLATVDWNKGSCSGCVYSGDEDLTRLMSRVYGEFAWTNPLHADVFPEIRKMEAEVVRMCCNMFNGDSESCGTMTSGGTESIMLACKAYRDIALEKGIKHPEIIAPVSAHAAFDKAAQLFRMKLTHTPVDPVTFKADVKAMKKAISRNTCLLVGSAPQFPQGVMDPIEDIAKLGLKYGIPVHVDSCLGGFLVPFMEKAGFSLPPFDFRVPGVTSISADTHKYGFAPKGSSVILYSDTKYRKHQFFVCCDWPGGIYASPTLAGSRAGAIIAACWATLMYMGEDGYIDSTRKIISTTHYIEDKLREIKGIFLYGKPEVSVVCIASLDFNIYRLSDALSKRGWNLNALQFPSCFHLCVTLVHTRPGVADRFLKDVSECVAEIMKDPNAKAGGMAAIYGMAQSIPDRSLVGMMTSAFLDGIYNTDSGVRNGINHH